jgi:GTPase
LHVRDISHPESAEQAAEVGDILASLGVGAGTPMFEVWNKLDLVEASAREALSVQARSGVFPVSALTGEGVDGLLDAVSAEFDEEKTERLMAVPFSDGRRRAWLHAEGVVLEESATDTGFAVRVRWTARQEKRYREL